MQVAKLFTPKSILKKLSLSNSSFLISFSYIISTLNLSYSGITLTWLILEVFIFFGTFNLIFFERTSSPFLSYFGFG